MRLRHVLPAVAVASLALPAPGHAETLLRTTVRADTSHWRTCHAAPARGTAVAAKRVRTASGGALTARMTGGTGDWDLAVFRASTGELLAASAQPGTAELAQGFALAGDELIVQACRIDGDGGAPRVRVDIQPLQRRYDMAPKLMRAHTRRSADRTALVNQGFDLAEGHNRDGSIDVVVYTAAQLAKLRSSGFRITTVIDDLIAHDLEVARKDRRYAEETEASGLPSGRTSYRHLADYELELKQLAQKYPGMAKLITMPQKSLLGRAVLGVEIASNVNRDDGRPIFLNMGVHHAREWPAGEMPMEFAYQLLTRYGKSERTTKLVDQARTVVVPIINVDGFTLSREAPLDLGIVNNQFGGTLGELAKPQADTLYGQALTNDPGQSYKRKNCRIKDGATPTAAECANADSSVGVDPNRNYGGFWGGPGAGLQIDGDETYRGPAPFSEPEVANVRQYISTHQVQTMITNHTFTGLVLRPPGIKSQGPPPDEEPYKALGDGMAKFNGYVSQKGYELYDTTGTTEDWSYYATGGYGFTFEIGFSEFHPEFQRGVVTEWQGEAGRQGGNREAYYLALANTADAANHAVLTGKAPAGSILRLHKAFKNWTSGIVDESGIPGERQSFEDVLDTTTTVGDDGTFTWHVNQSTRPLRAQQQKFVLVDATARKSTPIANTTPTGGEPGVGSEEVPFEIKADEPHDVLQVRIEMGTSQDDYDMYLYKLKDDGTREQISLSGGAAGAAENIVVPDPEVGKYVVEVTNFAAVGGWSGAIKFLGAKEVRVDKAQPETWAMTCERADGTVLARRDVAVNRGQKLDLGNACSKTGSKASAGAGKLKVKVKAARRGLGKALREGLRAKVTCSVRCTLGLTATVDGKTGKRLGLGSGRGSVLVARGPRAATLKGTKTFTLRFTKAAATRLRRARNASVSIIASAKASGRRRETVSTRLKLRR